MGKIKQGQKKFPNGRHGKSCSAEMELYWGYIRVIVESYMGIKENKLETAFQGLGFETRSKFKSFGASLVARCQFGPFGTVWAC